MAKSLPPLNWFRSFEAAARKLSSTAAAQELGLTQSAVSQQIRALETRLGVVLFRRHARGLALTDEGRKLLPQVETALETLWAAATPYLTGEGEDVLTIAASISVIEWIISPALHEFRRQQPETTVRFVSTIWPDEFVASSTDIEIRFGSERQVGRHAVALQPNRLIAVKSPVLRGNVQDLPLIQPVGTSDGWAAWGVVAGIENLKPTCFVDSYGLAMRLAADGNGVALASSAIADHALSSGQLVSAHDVTIPGKEGYYLSVQQSSPQAEAFAKWLIGRVRGGR